MVSLFWLWTTRNTSKRFGTPFVAFVASLIACMLRIVIVHSVHKPKPPTRRKTYRKNKREPPGLSGGHIPPFGQIDQEGGVCFACIEIGLICPPPAAGDRSGSSYGRSRRPTPLGRTRRNLYGKLFRLQGRRPNLDRIAIGWSPWPKPHGDQGPLFKA